jgi:hypothetical protein
VSQPLILDPAVHWCPTHLERYRERWPAGYAIASMVLVRAATDRPDVQQAAGYNVETGEKGDVARLPAVLREYGPLCCLVGDDTMTLVNELSDACSAWARAPDPSAARSHAQLRIRNAKRELGMRPEEGPVPEGVG